MATCLGIRTEKIRATIELSGIVIRTPYIKAFNVDKARQKLATTFSATVEISASSSFIAGADIVIYAGEKDNELKIFTGMIETITTQPSFDKAGYYVLSISGTDRLGELEGKTFSRRLKSDGFSSFVSITGGPANRPSRGVSIDKKVSGGKHQVTSNSPKPQDSDHTKITEMPKRGGHKHGPYGRAGGPDDWRQGQDGSLGVHDHSSVNKGGPAFATYSAD
jgi:hypothetical protein